MLGVLGLMKSTDLKNKGSASRVLVRIATTDMVVSTLVLVYCFFILMFEYLEILFNHM